MSKLASKQVGKLASSQAGGNSFFLSISSRSASRLSSCLPSRAIRPVVVPFFGSFSHPVSSARCLVSFRCGLCDPLTGCLRAMSELVKMARAGRCLPSPSRLVIRVSWTPGTEALGMWRYGGNRSSDEENPCLLFISPTARPTPGGGGLYEARRQWGAGDEGVGR